MKIIKNIVKLILIMIETISIIALLVIHIFSCTILDKNYVLNKLRESQYYAEIYESVQLNFEKYAGQSGLEENIFKNLVTEEKIKQDTEIILENIYTNNITKIDLQDFEIELTNRIENVYKQTLGINELTKVQHESIDNYVKTIANEYKKTIAALEYEDEIGDLIEKMNDYKNIVTKIAKISFAVSVVLLLFISIRNIGKVISSVAIPFISSSLLMIIFEIFINQKIKIENILILNESISNILISVIFDILNMIGKYCVVSLIIAILLIIIGNVLNEKLRKKE